MSPSLLQCAWLGLAVGQCLVQADHTQVNVREINVSGCNVVGKFKNLQGTNNANTDLVPPGTDNIHDMDPAIAELWKSYGIEHVLIYTFPQTFTGFGKNGTAGDPLLNDNYNWTMADEYVNFVVKHGAKASIQFNPSQGTNSTVSSPQILGDIGYMITDRYMNGANGSGFIDALELFDFYAESDLGNFPNIEQQYEMEFPYFAAFARGVAKANPKAGAGAWGGNRIWQAPTNYSVYDPYVSRFYNDCKAQQVPIKAATYHFSNAQFSFNPYDIKTITDRFRQDVLIPAGFPDLPIWVTESEPNPAGVQPTSAGAIQSYNDPSFFASFTLGASMYAQDTSLDQLMPWTGFGYGGTGAGDAPFQAWFNKSTVPVPLDVADAWKLQWQLISATPQRVRLHGDSSDGFAALSGRSADGRQVQILLNNYQLDYDIVREIAAQQAPFYNSSTTAYPIIQPNGLFNGQGGCFDASKVIFHLPICQTFPQATIRNNTSNAYRLKVGELPWGSGSAFDVTIQRVGGGEGLRTVKSELRRTAELDLTMSFPANAQDLVTITLM